MSDINEMARVLILRIKNGASQQGTILGIESIVNAARAKIKTLEDASGFDVESAIQGAERDGAGMGEVPARLAPPTAKDVSNG